MNTQARKETTRTSAFELWHIFWWSLYQGLRGGFKLSWISASCPGRVKVVNSLSLGNFVNSGLPPKQLVTLNLSLSTKSSSMLSVRTLKSCSVEREQWKEPTPFSWDLRFFLSNYNFIFPITLARLSFYLKFCTLPESFSRLHSLEDGVLNLSHCQRMLINTDMFIAFIASLLYLAMTFLNIIFISCI